MPETTSIERARGNYRRMKILKTMLRHFRVDRWADFEEIRGACRVDGLALVRQQLDFHLRLMAAKPNFWVEVDIGETDEDTDVILRAKLTARGMDRVDIGSMPGLAAGGE